MLRWLPRRSKFQTPEYSVETQSTFREGRRIVYREKDRMIDFSAEAVGEKWNQLNAMVPEGVEDAERDRIVKNVANGLEQLGFEYVIFQRGEKQIVPEPERAAAKNRLREMGFEANLSANGAVKISRLYGRSPADRKERYTAADSVEIMRCVSALRGVRSTPKILAKSSSANAEFV